MSIRSFRVGSEQKKESELNIEMEPRKFNGQKKETEQKKKDSAWTTCRQNPLFRGGVIRLRLERRTVALEGRCSIQLSYRTSLMN